MIQCICVQKVLSRWQSASYAHLKCDHVSQWTTSNVAPHFCQAFKNLFWPHHYLWYLQIVMIVSCRKLSLRGTNGHALHQIGDQTLNVVLSIPVKRNTCISDDQLDQQQRYTSTHRHCVWPCGPGSMGGTCMSYGWHLLPMLLKPETVANRLQKLYLQGLPGEASFNEVSCCMFGCCNCDCISCSSGLQKTGSR